MMEKEKLIKCKVRFDGKFCGDKIKKCPFQYYIGLDFNMYHPLPNRCVLFKTNRSNNTRNGQCFKEFGTDDPINERIMKLKRTVNDRLGFMASEFGNKMAAMRIDVDKEIKELLTFIHYGKSQDEFENEFSKVSKLLYGKRED